MFSLFKKDPQSDIASALYLEMTKQARNPVFYTDFEVPDTLEGRFDLITLHAYLVLDRLKSGAMPIDQNNGQKHDPDHIQDLSQKFLDAMFKNLDDNLRQMGVGDLSVSRKVRAMAEAFYGRAGVYERALTASLQSETNHGQQDLVTALLRNIYGVHENKVDEDASIASQKAQAENLATYVLHAKEILGEQPLSRLTKAIIDFPDPGQIRGREGNMACEGFSR